MQFGTTDHTALICDASRAAGRETRPSSAPADQRADGIPATDRRLQSSDHQQALQQLASRSFTSRLTRERMQKVITWSMAADHVVRRATIPVLMQIGSGMATQALVRLLDDPNHTIQGEAAEALGQVRDTTAIEAIRNLLQHPNEDVALRAALALAQMKDKSGLRVASRILQSDSPLNRRAARTLGVIVGRGFRPNSVGLAAARKYLATNHID
jgi:HEAT repeat protein